MSIQRITILGQRISLVRPSRPRNPITFKSDLPYPRYNKRPKTKKFGCAEFFKLCLEYNEKLKGGEL